MRSILDFGESYRTEDRWLRFALRASFVMFVISVQAVLVVGLASFLWVAL